MKPSTYSIIASVITIATILTHNNVGSNPLPGPDSDPNFIWYPNTEFSTLNYVNPNSPSEVYVEEIIYEVPEQFPAYYSSGPGEEGAEYTSDTSSSCSDSTDINDTSTAAYVPYTPPASSPVPPTKNVVPRAADTYSGDGTYYAVGEGACGGVSVSTDLIAALNAPQFGVYGDPNDSPMCNKCALVKTADGLNSVKVRIVDLCEGCEWGSLDFSTSAFQALSPLSAGRISITWSFCSC